MSRYRLFALALLLFNLEARAERNQLSGKVIGKMPIRAEGYAMDRGDFFFWGDGVYRWPLGQPGGKPERIATGTYREGGCALDVNGDGRSDLVLNESHALIWLEAPSWEPHVIDRGVDSLDVIPATLFGKRGALLIHKRMQVRFYAIPADPRAPWPETEIYSFYTPSDEGGLALADVNGDGRPDILAGSYFIESPALFELPWHLWAIDTWTEAKMSALLRLAWIPVGDGPPTRVAIQRAMPGARFAWFERETDFKKLWPPHDIAGQDELSAPYTMFPIDLDGTGHPGIIVAERAGKGRLLFYANQPTGFTGVEIHSGKQWRGGFPMQIDGAERPSLLAFDDKELYSYSSPGHLP